MGIFGKLISLPLQVAVSLPVDLVKDTLTLGGSVNGKDEPYTTKRIEKILKEIDTLGDD